MMLRDNNEWKERAEQMREAMLKVIFGGQILI